jgi:hypothetical protein
VPPFTTTKTLNILKTSRDEHTQYGSRVTFPVIRPHSFNIRFFLFGFPRRQYACYAGIELPALASFALTL